MKGYRTVIFNILVLIVPILELAEMQAIVPEEYLLYYIVAVSIANLILRKMTTTPIGQKNA